MGGELKKHPVFYTCGICAQKGSQHIAQFCSEQDHMWSILKIFFSTRGGSTYFPLKLSLSMIWNVAPKVATAQEGTFGANFFQIHVSWQLRVSAEDAVSKMMAKVEIANSSYIVIVLSLSLIFTWTLPKKTWIRNLAVFFQNLDLGEFTWQERPFAGLGAIRIIMDYLQTVGIENCAGEGFSPECPAHWLEGTELLHGK